MAGKVLQLDEIITKDDIGCYIANQWVTWDTYRQSWRQLQEEKRKYIFATDTRQTTNSQLPWKNSTTIPKMCHIRDNLFANYMATLFPKRKFLGYEAASSVDNVPAVRDAVLKLMQYALNQDRQKQEAAKIVSDYIDYGNCFITVEWVDERATVGSPPTKVGYVGPILRRISPLDINFNPASPSFAEAPKIVRSLVSLGEVKKILESQSTDQDHDAYKELFKYLTDIRFKARDPGITDIKSVDGFFQMDGFTSFRNYLCGDYVEILTYYGDIYDSKTQEFKQNQQIMVVDRHKVISMKDNPSFFGTAPIYHVGWRIRQDNLWAMGPLDNLIGMQYRIDHIENAKADVIDLIVYPVLKIKGYVQDFTWGPMQRIQTDAEGDVEMLAPPFQVLQLNVEIQQYIQLMEEMAGSPKEAMGFRTPGEKTAFEVQRLENASTRIFTSKTSQLEEQGFERAYNAMLELFRRNLNEVIEVSVFDEELRFQDFEAITPDMISGAGKVKPLAARHFAEKAELIQTLQGVYQMLVNDPMTLTHMSSVQMAKMIEYAAGFEDWKLVTKDIRISEQADMERMKNAADQQTIMQAGTPTGLTPDDVDPDIDQQMTQEFMGEAPVA